jgi:hypothetical protein
MDDSAEYWFSTSEGCNYCDDFLIKKSLKFQEIRNDSSCEQILDRYRDSSRDYDCMFLLSGGVDSSYALHKLYQLGVKPLVVNMNNSWDANLAQQNIEKIISKTNFDFHSEVIDWKTYREWQQLLMRSDLIDLEILYDQAVAGVASRIAKEFGLKLVVTGSNSATEGMVMAPNWALPEKRDPRLLFDIDKKFGDGNLRESKFPFHSIFNAWKDMEINKIRFLPILNYLPYIKNEAVIELKDEYEFEAYEGKHHESIFTRFYQSVILWEKGKIDKRKNHLSCLVLNHQLSRDEALSYIQQPPSHYSEKESDQEFVLKKLQMSLQEFNKYVNRPVRSFKEFKNLQAPAIRKIRLRLKS